jgi:hypothetical protein
VSNGKFWNTSNRALTNFTYRPQFQDHGKSLTCQVYHPNWDQTYPNLTCGYDRLSILYSPRLDCDSKQYIWDNQEDYAVYCNILSNPLIPENELNLKVRAEDVKSKIEL